MRRFAALLLMVPRSWLTRRPRMRMKRRTRSTKACGHLMHRTLQTVRTCSLDARLGAGDARCSPFLEFSEQGMSLLERATLRFSKTSRPIIALRLIRTLPGPCPESPSICAWWSLTSEFLRLEMSRVAPLFGMLMASMSVLLHSRRPVVIWASRTPSTPCGMLMRSAIWVWRRTTGWRMMLASTPTGGRARLAVVRTGSLSPRSSRDPSETSSVIRSEGIWQDWVSHSL
mmetsp:Transcript_25115/g.57044  ORF Transcript_25115/g.57044 Transcript_25115/m.57044 type:complete len:229 (-) Transcript_25115:2173-2859(-)